MASRIASKIARRMATTESQVSTVVLHNHLAEGAQHAMTANYSTASTVLDSSELPRRIGFEAPENHHRALAHHLGQAGFDLKLIATVGLARTREALHNGWD